MNSPSAPKILCVVGTRPEAIKMAPIISALRQGGWANVRVIATAQHRHLLDQVLNHFGIAPDLDFDAMRPNQSLAELTARLIAQSDQVVKAEAPQAVLVQGDTTTVLAVSLAAFYNKVPIGHVEAGLRTWDLDNPFPEEANRVVTARLARWHFAPTQSAAANLIREGIDEANVIVTGNSVIDALLSTAARAENDLGLELPATQRLILVTSHRRENFGEPLRRICGAIRTLAIANPDSTFLFPVHPNPAVRSTVHEMLGGRVNIVLREPLEYGAFVAAMKRSHLILTDSGGVQEEAPALGKPVLVFRNETERPEAVALGAVRLVGPNEDRIVAGVQELLDDPQAYQRMVIGHSPYGDGLAAGRIENFLRKTLVP